MTDPWRRQAYGLYLRGVPLEEIVTLRRDYSLQHLRVDLWAAIPHGERSRGIAKAGWHQVGGGLYDEQDWVTLVLTRNFGDLLRGKPCTLGLPLGKHRADYCVEVKRRPVADHPYPGGDGGPFEIHTCAEDAYAWFTSWEFVCWCEESGCTWENLARAAVGLAALVQSRLPFLVLRPAWEWARALEIERDGAIPTMEAMGRARNGDAHLSHQAL